MWLKRKTPVRDEIPELKEEYQRLLQETLPDMRPLREVTEPRGMARAEVEAQWAAHQRVLRPSASPTRRIAPRKSGEACPERALTPACA